MKTKQVEYYVDLYPGWQDWKEKPWFFTNPNTERSPGVRRYKLIVELPCFGGSEDVSGVVQGEVKGDA